MCFICEDVANNTVLVDEYVTQINQYQYIETNCFPQPQVTLVIS